MNAKEAHELSIQARDLKNAKTNAEAKIAYDGIVKKIKTACEKGLFEIKITDNFTSGTPVMDIVIENLRKDGYTITHKPGGCDFRDPRDSWPGEYTIKW